MEKKQLIYLASPYSNPVTEIRAYRHRKAVECAADLIRQGYLVFSPIVHSHEIAQTLGKDYVGFNSWREFDLRMLRCCDVLAVTEIEGWEESCGIKVEMRKAHRWKIPIKVCIFDEGLRRWRIEDDNKTNACS